MKRILFLLIAVTLFGNLAGYAQSANRKGFFMELRGGVTQGMVYKAAGIGYYSDEYMKGGFDLGISFGGRFATSTHWAFQMKLDVSDNMSAPGGYLRSLLRTAVILGMRWTSLDFAGNKSAYIGVGTGAGISPLARELCTFIPIEIDAGINLTNKLSVGLFALPKIKLATETIIDAYYNYSYHDLRYRTNTVLGLKLGYRF